MFGNGLFEGDPVIRQSLTEEFQLSGGIPERFGNIVLPASQTGNMRIDQTLFQRRQFENFGNVLIEIHFRDVDDRPQQLGIGFFESFDRQQEFFDFEPERTFAGLQHGFQVIDDLIIRDILSFEIGNDQIDLVIGRDDRIEFEHQVPGLFLQFFQVIDFLFSGRSKRIFDRFRPFANDIQGSFIDLSGIFSRDIGVQQAFCRKGLFPVFGRIGIVPAPQIQLRGIDRSQRLGGIRPSGIGQMLADDPPLANGFTPVFNIPLEFIAAKTAVFRASAVAGFGQQGLCFSEVAKSGCGTGIFEFFEGGRIGSDIGIISGQDHNCGNGHDQQGMPQSGLGMDNRAVKIFQIELSNGNNVRILQQPFSACFQPVSVDQGSIFPAGIGQPAAIRADRYFSVFSGHQLIHQEDIAAGCRTDDKMILHELHNFAGVRSAEDLDLVDAAGLFNDCFFNNEQTISDRYSIPSLKFFFRNPLSVKKNTVSASCVTHVELAFLHGDHGMVSGGQAVFHWNNPGTVPGPADGDIFGNLPGLDFIENAFFEFQADG